MPITDEAPQNPGYANLGGLVREVLEFGFNDGPQVNKKRIETWINEAQSKIARKVNAPEFLESERIQLTAGVYQYALPADFIRGEDIFYPKLLQRLRRLDISQFDEMGHGEPLQAELQAEPEYYTFYKNELCVFPFPSSGATENYLELRYFANPPYMKEETAVPVLNPDYWHLLVKYAVVRAFEAEDDFELAQQHLTRYKQDLDEYATDVQERNIDRPRIVDGTWGAIGTGGMRGVI